MANDIMNREPYNMSVLNHRIKVVFDLDEVPLAGDEEEQQEERESLEYVLGCNSFKYGTVYIDPRMSDDYVASTLVHELVHQILMTQSIEHTEGLTDSLAMGILSLIQENPEVMKQLQDVYFDKFQ